VEIGSEGPQTLLRSAIRSKEIFNAGCYIHVLFVMVVIAADYIRVT